jgi:hypothetical protein
MSVQSNYPNLRPSLLLDFANTRQLDSRVTFTRSTPAVYYDGKTTAMAEQNLLLQSQTFNTTWAVNAASITADSTTAPDGTTTADTLTSAGTDACLTYQAKPTSSSGTISCYIKKGTSNYAYMYVDNPSLTGNAAFFDINTGVIGSYSGAFTSASIVSVGNGWYRCIATFSGISGTNVGFGVCDTSSSTPCTSGRTIYIWGAQIEQRSTATAYTATTTQPITNYIPVLLTAGGNQARFDHNPTTGESLGLLIEEQRTNLLTYSEQFNTGSWVASGSTIYSNYAIAPDANLTADRLYMANNSQTPYQLFNFANGVTYTFSCYVKRTWSTNQVFRLAKFQTAQALSSDFTATSDWQRFTFTIVGNGDALSSSVYFSVGSSGASADILIWGAQLEVGSFATSYIATTSASATRTADVASMTGTNFSSWYNQAEGTLYAESLFNSGSITTDQLIIAVDANTNGYRNKISRYNGSVYGTTTNGSAQADIGLGSANSQNTLYKSSYVYKTNDFSGTVNSGTVATDSSGTVPTGLSQALIGKSASGEYLNGTIRKLAYYPFRVTNTQLQALTS